MSNTIGDHHESAHESHSTHEPEESHHSDESHDSDRAGESQGASSAGGTEHPDESKKPEATGHSSEDAFVPTDDGGKKEFHDKMLGTPPPEEKGDGFTGANYVDTGLVPGPDGQPLDPRITDNGDPTQDPPIPSNEERVRADIRADLEALKADGIDTVRVFVQPPGGFSEAEGDAYYEKVTRRMELVAEEASKLDMRVTIDLLNDGDGQGGMAEYLNDAHTGQLDRLTQKVVPNLKGFDNVDWSIGNELKAPAEQSAFCDWYVDKARALREQMGPGQRVIAELTPGALDHPGFPPNKESPAYQSMLRIANASDVVSIHFYPPTVEPLPDHVHGMDIRPALDWQSVQAWKQAAEEAPLPARFEIGEFSVPRDTYLPAEVQQGLAKTPEDYKAIADYWVQKLHDMGVQKVSFWQYQKSEDGFGTDPTSWDRVDNVKDGKEYMHIGAEDMQPLVKQWSLLVPIRP